MRIRAIRDVKEDHEIVLPPDEKKNLHFMVTERGHHSELFAGIRSCLTRGMDARVSLELDHMGRFDPRLVLVEDYADYRNLLNYIIETGHMDDFAGISEQANRTFCGILSENMAAESEEFLPASGISASAPQPAENMAAESEEFLRLEGGQIMIRDIRVAAEKTIAYHSLLAAIRRTYRVDAPLIVNGFGRNARRHTLSLARLVSDTVPQALIFTTEANFGMWMHGLTLDVQVRSAYEMIRDSFMGSTYRIGRDGVSRYESRF